MGSNECGREVRMSLDEHRGNPAVENDLKYLLMFGSEIPDDASIKFPSSCRRKACVEHVRSRLQLEVQVEHLSTSGPMILVHELQVRRINVQRCSRVKDLEYSQHRCKTTNLTM